MSDLSNILLASPRCSSRCRVRALEHHRDPSRTTARTFQAHVQARQREVSTSRPHQCFHVKLRSVTAPPSVAAVTRYTASVLILWAGLVRRLISYSDKSGNMIVGDSAFTTVLWIDGEVIKTYSGEAREGPIGPS
jgi:hypothetical protein